MENVPREFGVDDLFWSQHPGRVFDVMGGGGRDWVSVFMTYFGV